MKWAKWILGIIVAGVLTLGTANIIMHRTGNVDMNNLTAFQYWITFLAIPSVAFGLFLFLSCVFVRFQKKYAGLAAFLLSTIFIGLGAYQHYTDDGILHNQYIIRYTGFIVGLISGFLLSYRLYSQNRWTSY